MTFNRRTFYSNFSIKLQTFRHVFLLIHNGLFDLEVSSPDVRLHKEWIKVKILLLFSMLHFLRHFFSLCGPISHDDNVYLAIIISRPNSFLFTTRHFCVEIRNFIILKNYILSFGLFAVVHMCIFSVDGHWASDALVE